MKKDLKYYLNLPYKIEIIPIPLEEGGGYSAQIPDLGKYSIVGDGETPQEAIEDLNEIKELRFKHYLENGVDIPEPKKEDDDYSGRFVLRLPKDLHRLLANKAAKNQSSLNSYLIYLVSYAMSNSKTQKQFDTILTRLDLMTDVIWSVDYQKSNEIGSSLPADIEEEVREHLPTDLSKFKKAA